MKKNTIERKNLIANKGRYDERIVALGERVSGDSRETGRNNNVMVLASTGAGKTGSYIYPNLKEARNQSLLISDSKGQLSRLFRKELEEKGYEVKILSLLDLSKSSGYNPLDYIRIENGQIRYQDVMMLSKAMMGQQLSSDEPFWELSAQLLLQFFIGYTLEALPEEDHNMLTVSKLYHAFIAPSGMHAFRAWTEEHPDSFPARKLREFLATTAADKMNASIRGFVNIAMLAFELPEAVHLFQNEDTIDIRDLAHKKMAVFLEVSDTDHSLDVIQNLIFMQAIQTLFREADQTEDGRLPVPVTIYMDDFAANMYLPDFDKTISVTRSRDIAVTVVLQSLSQLNSLYGADKAKTILNNCDTLIYMGAQDLQTAQYIGERAGCSEYQILSLPRDKEYLILGGSKAKLARKIPPYSYECMQQIMPYEEKNMDPEQISCGNKDAIFMESVG